MHCAGVAEAGRCPVVRRSREGAGGGGAASRAQRVPEGIPLGDSTLQ